MQKYEFIVKSQSQLVTVFMLTHNRAFYLEQAINSVLAQEYKNFTLIVLDNMSTDKTKELVERFCERDSRIIYIQRESNNLFDNTVFAFENCKTRFLIVLHDDDLLYPNYLGTVLNEIDKSDYSALSPATETIDENGRITGVCQIDEDKIEYKDEKYFISHFKKTTPSMIYPAVIYRTSFYKDFHNFINKDAGPAFDQLIWFESERHGGKLCFFNKVLFKYRNHNSQFSEQKRFFMDLELIDYLIHHEYYKEKINNRIDDMSRYVWILFRGITLYYCKGYIDGSKYKSFFSYLSLQYIMDNSRLKYKMILKGCRAIYYLRFFIKVMFKGIKWVRMVTKLK